MAKMTKNTTKAPKGTAATTLFAVLAAGGKQYIVRTGDLVTTEKMEGEFKAGDAMTFDDVLLYDDGKKTEVGAPKLARKVTAEFVREGREPKVIVIKYKAKSRYFKKRGHRQPFQTWKITAIA